MRVASDHSAHWASRAGGRAFRRRGRVLVNVVQRSSRRWPVTGVQTPGVGASRPEPSAKVSKACASGSSQAGDAGRWSALMGRSAATKSARRGRRPRARVKRAEVVRVLHELCRGTGKRRHWERQARLMARRGAPRRVDVRRLRAAANIRNRAGRPRCSRTSRARRR
jgi:hypothetical protein